MRIYKGTWGITYGDWDLQNGIDIAHNYGVTYSDDGTSFSVDLDDIATNEGYAIYYSVKVDYTPVENELFDNEGTFNPSGVNRSTWDSVVKYASAEGSVEGNAYAYFINLLKTNESDGALAPVEFSVTRNSMGAVIGTRATDSDGTALISGLLKDDYTLSETIAPTEYTLLGHAISMSSSDFNVTAKIASVSAADTAKAYLSQSKRVGKAVTTKIVFVLTRSRYIYLPTAL